jgi:hypothetical protein
VQQHFRLRLLFVGRQALRSDPVQPGWLPRCQPSYKCAQEGEVYHPADHPRTLFTFIQMWAQEGERTVCRPSASTRASIGASG